MHENGNAGHETAKLGRSKGVREFGTKRPRVRIPPLRLPGTLKINAPGVLLFLRISAYFRFATQSVAARRQGTIFRSEKSPSAFFRKYPLISGFEMSGLAC